MRCFVLLSQVLCIFMHIVFVATRKVLLELSEGLKFVDPRSSDAGAANETEISHFDRH